MKNQKFDTVGYDCYADLFYYLRTRVREEAKTTIETVEIGASTSEIITRCFSIERRYTNMCVFSYSFGLFAPVTLTLTR